MLDGFARSVASGLGRFPSLSRGIEIEQAARFSTIQPTRTRAGCDGRASGVRVTGVFDKPIVQFYSEVASLAGVIGAGSDTPAAGLPKLARDLLSLTKSTHQIHAPQCADI